MEQKKGTIINRVKGVIAGYLKQTDTTGLKTNPRNLSVKDRLSEDLLLEGEETRGLSLALDQKFLSEYQPGVVSDPDLGGAKTVGDVIAHIKDLLTEKENA
jgi:hypothetical protein